MYEQHLHACAIVLFQEILPLVSSIYIHPGTWPTQYYQSWRLGHEPNDSPAEYCWPQKGFQWDHLQFFTQRSERSLTISQLHGGWFSQQRRPEIKFLYQGLKRTVQPKLGCPYQYRWCWVTSVAPLMQGIANVIDVEPPMAPQKLRKWKHCRRN